MPDQTEVDVVIVDDVQDSAEALACLLEMDGYRVALAFDAAEALQVIQDRRPHCVLLDFGLPDIDGLELTRRLRDRYGDDIVLVAVTGYSSDNERVADTFARVDHHFIKPVSPAQLRKVLPPMEPLSG